MKRGGRGQAAAATKGGVGGMDAIERMLYGDVDDDPDLEAELLAMQAEVGDEAEDNDEEAPPLTSSSTRSKAAMKESVDRGLVKKMPPPSSQHTFDDFDKLARQISEEVAVEDDINDESVDDDEELLAELNRVVVEPMESGGGNPGSHMIEKDVAPPAVRPMGSGGNPSSHVVKDVAPPAVEPMGSGGAAGHVIGDVAPPAAPPRVKSNNPTAAATTSQAIGQNEQTTQILTDRLNANKSAAPKSTTTSPGSVVEALQQRMEKYRSTATKAAEDGDTSKQRRMNRICKQYDDAIRDYKARKPVNFEDLPVPPGFPPLPLPRQNAGPASAPDLPKLTPTTSTLPDESSKRLSSSSSTSAVQSKVLIPPAKLSRQQQQLNFLLERQRQFKCAALDAKRRGDVGTAKNFLRQALGFNQMIEASRNGLPVDISNTPTPPQSKTAPRTLKPTVGVSKVSSDLALDKIYGPQSEASALVRENREESYASLEADLIRQVQLCDHNRDYFTKFGEVAKVTLFEKLGSICKKDLDSLRNGFRHGDPVPRFHYETRTFPVLHCCPDLGADDLEIQVVRGLMLKLPAGYEPKDADIFVKFDFPFPKDNPQTDRTANVRGTNSPTFNHSHKMKVNTKSRQFLLAYKRHGVKFEVYQKGSLFRSDKLLGSAEVKLLGLEKKAEIHESLDLMEGRKPAGGKLEVKIRIREPLVHKTVEEMKEKWLIIDEFIRVPKGVLAKSRLIPDMM